MPDLPTLVRPTRTVAPLDRLGAVTLVLGAAVLAVTFALNPGPGAAHVTDPGWGPGHLLTGVAYVLLLLGVPGLMVHFAVSSGSQLYYARIVPVLAGLPVGQAGLGAGGRLSDLYGGWRDAFDLVTALALLALAYGCWRGARTLRALAVLLVVAALGEVFVTPVALGAYVLVLGWCPRRPRTRLRSPGERPRPRTGSG